MIIGVASGKGGTGKTTVSLNLAFSARETVLLLDCDVEEPNCHLFFDAPMQETETVAIGVPKLYSDRCVGCGDCAKICEFQAVAFLAGRPLLFPELCHGCGGCMLACPTKALIETGSEIGVVEQARAGRITLVHGRLHVGKAISPPLIRAVRGHQDPKIPTIVDCPPGTTCSLAAAISGCDLALLVAEPTPFGIHDLGLLVGGIRQLGLPMGVIINRSRKGVGQLREYCKQADVPVVAEIPESLDMARAGARGHIASNTIPETRDIFDQIWRTLLDMVQK